MFLIEGGKEVFRTCNVLPFSCTHLALWRGKGKGKDPRYMQNKKDSRISLEGGSKISKIRTFGRLLEVVSSFDFFYSFDDFSFSGMSKKLVSYDTIFENKYGKE